MIDTQTRLMGLLGKPLGQSFSAAMHAEAFRALGLNCAYLPMECEADELAALIGGLRVMNFTGFNVTKPYKVEVIQYLDELDNLARLLGAVNTVKVQNGRLVGHNTDGTGFCESLTSELGFSAGGKRFLIFGAGGASRAVAVTLAFQGAESVTVTDLYPNLAQDLCGHINQNVKPCAQTLLCDEIDKIRDEAMASDCIINASGVGMYPHVERTPLEKDCLRPGQVVCDLTYNPEKTQLLKDAEAIGCPVMNGLGMLLWQGVKAFEIWLEQPAPVEAMRAALLKMMEQV